MPAQHCSRREGCWCSQPMRSDSSWTKGWQRATKCAISRLQRSRGISSATRVFIAVLKSGSSLLEACSSGDSAFGLVQRDRRANESFQRVLFDLLTFVKVDRSPRVSLEAGVE